MIMRDGGWWRKSPLFSYKVNIRTSKDDTMQCRILPREHRTPGLPWRCWNHCSRSSHKPGGEGRGVTGITGTGADEADQARGLLWSSMLLIFSNFRIAELGIAWRTCEMDRILCHKAVALMDALELGACLKGSLALLIFGTFSIFSFQKTYRYTDHTQIIHRSYPSLPKAWTKHVLEANFQPSEWQRQPPAPSILSMYSQSTWNPQTFNDFQRGQYRSVRLLWKSVLSKQNFWFSASAPRFHGQSQSLRPPLQCPMPVGWSRSATCYAMLRLFSKDETPVKLAVAILPLSSRCCTPAEAQFCDTRAIHQLNVTSSIPSPSLLHPSSLQNLVRKGGAWQLVHVFHSSPCRAGSLAAMP